MKSCVEPKSLHKNKNQCERNLYCVSSFASPRPWRTACSTVGLRNCHSRHSSKWRRSMNTKKKNPLRRRTSAAAAPPTVALRRRHITPHLLPACHRSTKGPCPAIGTAPRGRGRCPRSLQNHIRRLLQGFTLGALHTSGGGTKGSSYGGPGSGRGGPESTLAKRSTTTDRR